MPEQKTEHQKRFEETMKRVLTTPKTNAKTAPTQPEPKPSGQKEKGRQK